MSSYKKLGKSNFHKSVWNGGETTELFILPAISKYDLKNFELRISTATVESESSTFTDFSGFQRKLMVLEGKIKLLYQKGTQEKVIVLTPFEQYQFDGADVLKCFGQCRDFNVIYQKKYKVNLEVLSQESYQTNRDSLYLLYAPLKAVEIRLGDETLFLEGGDAITLEGELTMSLVGTGRESKLIICQIDKQYHG